jgi:hypothetical protein
MNIARNKILPTAIRNKVAKPNILKMKKTPHIGSKRNGREKERQR